MIVSLSTTLLLRQMLSLIFLLVASLFFPAIGQSCPSTRPVELCCPTRIPYSANPGFQLDCHIEVKDPSVIMGVSCSAPSGPDW